MNIDNLVLQQPQWLWLLPLLLALHLASRAYRRDEGNDRLEQGLTTDRTRVRHPLQKLFKTLPSAGKARPYLHQLLLWPVLACLVLALAQPQRIGEKRPDPPRQRDIVFIVDTSVSMTLRDYQIDGERIDRMSVIRAMLDNFIEQLKGDRVSLIAFADSAHVLVPLTSDQALLRHMLPKLRPGIAGRTNAIGEAIALAVKQAAHNRQGKRVLVLVSDAALPTGSITPQQAAALARREQLPLYTLAVGAGSYDAEEQRITGLIYHPANLALLKELAAITGAKSYQAGDQAALQAAINEIEQIEKNTRPQPARYFHEDLYHWPLLLSLLLLSVYQLGILLRQRLLA